MKRTDSPAFSGFSKQGLAFLAGLAKNNRREWFMPRRPLYERELLGPLQSLVADASEAMRAAKIPLSADPRRPTFRIYRDIRFSHDKRPYKTNLGAFLSQGGVHDAGGGLYIHIQPKQSFMAVAFYRLEKPDLERWRAAMTKRPAAFHAMLRALAKNKLVLSVDGEALKRMPRGYEAFADDALAPYLRMGSFMVSEKLTDSDVGSRRLVDRMVAFAKRARPLLDYGRSLV